jgi:DNA-binding NtrC family response regulator
VQSFVEQICRENGLKVKTISPEALEILSAYQWPGNVRELRNVIERLVILSDEGIGVGDLPEEIVAEANRQARPVLTSDREHGRAAARGTFVTAS